MARKDLDLVDLRMLAWLGVGVVAKALLSSRGEVAALLPVLRQSLPPPFGAAWVMLPYGCPEDVLREVAAMSGLREKDIARRLVFVRLDGVHDAAGYTFWFAVDLVKAKRGILEVHIVVQDSSAVCYRAAMGGEAGP